MNCYSKRIIAIATLAATLVVLPVSHQVSRDESIAIQHSFEITPLDVSWGHFDSARNPVVG